MKQFFSSNKLLLLAIMVWSGVIVVYSYNHLLFYQQRILAHAKAEADGSHNKDLLYRRWVAKQGGIYVIQSEYTPPSPWLQHVPYRDLTTTQGVPLTLVNPAYMTRQVCELATQQYGAKGHITSLNPLRPQNAPDEWEKQTLDQLTSASEIIYSVEKIGAEEYLRALYPMITEESCLKCHGQQGYVVGDIRGGISVSVPLAPCRAIFVSTLRSKFIFHGVVWIIGVIFIVVLDRYRKRLRKSYAAAITSERKFRTLFDEAKTCYDLLDLETGEFVDCNQAFADLVGRPISELIGQSHTIVHPAEHQRGDDEIESFAQVKNSADGTLVQTQFITPDGIIREVEIRAQKIEIDGRAMVFGSVNDITERIGIEKQLRLSAKVFESSDEGITITDTTGAILTVNRAFTNITGYSKQEAVGENPRILKSGKHDEQFYRNMWQKLLNDGRWQGEIWNKRKNGEVYPEVLTINSICDDNDNLTNYVAVFTDIAVMKNMVELLDYQAHHHSVTGLPNRWLFDTHLASVLQQGQQGAVFYIDLDNFKHSNDSLGYTTGDKILIEVGQRLQQHCGESDLLAHLGADEFILMVDKPTAGIDTDAVARKLLESVQPVMVIDGHELYITCSIGVAVFPNDGITVDELLSNANAAVFKAKENGKNGYHHYSRQLTDIALERVVLNSALRHALEGDEFVLYYQPQVALSQGNVVGCEVLVRWQHPELGLVPPDKFIPLCEENGLIIPLGEWILETACKQWLSWRDQGYEPGRIAVNLSGRQIQSEDLPGTVAAILERTGFPVSFLELEITETFLMQHPEQAIIVLEQINAMGIEFSIDDFGTGHSSLNYLKRFPVSRLKIDRDFINDVQPEAEDCVIVKAIVALGHALDLKIVAEGIETEFQRQYLAELQCEEAQGYFFSKPVPAHEFVKFIS